MKLPTNFAFSITMPMHELNRLLQAIKDLHEQLSANQQAWEGEEDSVKDEKEALIQNNEWYLNRYKELAE